MPNTLLKRARILPFLSLIEKDREANLAALISKAKRLKIDGLDLDQWDNHIWKIKSGHLAKHSGKNIITSSLKFHFSPEVGEASLPIDWENLIKALVVLRIHRKNQAITNQRRFIAAASYVAFELNKKKHKVYQLDLESFDSACRLIALHYSQSTAYCMQKALSEFAMHCDANGLCKTYLNFRYSNMKWPENASGIASKRLDDPTAAVTNGEKLIAPEVFRTLGELYQNVPKNHKYRFYVLILTLLACLGRRFSEIALLPHQETNHDNESRAYIEYFPRKYSYGDDLKKLGLSTTLLDTTGWLRKNNYTYPDYDKLTQQGIRTNHPIQYTTKIGIIQYCQRDFFPTFNNSIHIDQNGKHYYLQDLLLARHRGLSSGAYSCWIATPCTHSMITTFLRYLDDLVSQHASREKRALMLREDIKKGRVEGQIVDKLKSIPVTVQDAFLKAKVNAVHDVGSGICIHNFVQTPCERHLQCSADCKDYVWAKEDTGRIEELKRQYAMTAIARETAEKKSKEKNSKKSIDWLAHNDKKLFTLSKQLIDNDIPEFDPHQYLEELSK